MKTLKKALAMLLCVAMVFTLDTAYGYKKVDADTPSIEDMIADADYNVALHKTAYGYPNVVEGNIEFLTDGVLGAQDASDHVCITEAYGYNGESYATIDLGDTYEASTIDEIVAQYRYGTANVGTATVVGKDYSIQYSSDGDTYVTVASTTNTVLDDDRMTYDYVSGVTGAVRYVRLYFPETVQYSMQLLELAVLDTDLNLATADPSEELVVPEGGGDPSIVVDPDGIRHSQYMYLVSVSEEKIVGIDTSTNQVKADGDMDLLDDVESLPNNMLFYTVDGTDERFDNYVAIRSPYNNSSISGQGSGLTATGGTSTTGWEIFKFVMQEDGTVALFSTNGDTYVTLGDGGVLKPGATSVGDTEKFYFTLPMNYSEVPVAPEVEVASRDTSSITIDWSVDHGLYTGFEVYRKDGAGEYQKIADTIGTTYTDTNLLVGTEYSYMVVTICADMASEGTQIQAKTLSSYPAEAPMNISVSEDNGALLTWESAANADYYNIYRASGRYSEYEKIGSTGDTSYNDNTEDSAYNYYYKITSVNADGEESDFSDEAALDLELFGDTVYIYSPTDDTSIINSQIKAVSDKMMPAETSEFSSDRYAIMFKPGDYDINTINVGFYTQIMGLGALPTDVSIRNINVDSNGGNDTLINFWRGVENLSVMTGSDTTEVKWGTSQAAPLRRMYVQGKLHFDDIGKTASGGYLADTYVSGQTGSWSQQQFFVRNTHMEGGWYDGCWNMVFVGCENAPDTTDEWATSTYQSYTTIDDTEKIREKPFLYLDETEGYKVFVPSLRENTSGISWSDSYMGDGTSMDIDEFYIAKADTDTAESINKALSSGKSIIFTPGMYDIEEPLLVEKEDTILLGLGLATLRCENTDTAIKVSDVGGVNISGIILEAEIQGSDSLLEMGDENAGADHSSDPSWISDVYVRVGGYSVGSCENGIVINSSNVIGDHFWLWRADHGEGASWNGAQCDTGLLVNGDNVYVYGLFCEHFQKYQTLWNGENGKMYFYQSELPYDVPSQSDWMSHDGTQNGYASYKVADDVTSHEAYGLGVYEVFIYTGEYMNLKSAIEVPENASIFHACTVHLSADDGSVQSGSISYVVNESGPAVGKGITAQGLKKGINYYPDDSQSEEESTTAPDAGGDESTSESIEGSEDDTTKADGSDKDQAGGVSGTNGSEGFVDTSAAGNTSGSVSGSEDTKAPAKAVIKKVKTNKRSLRKIKITIKKVKGASGYEAAVYKTRKKAKKNKKAIKVKTKSKRKITIKSKKMKNRKKVFVRVRAYTVGSDGQKVYGAWSKVKKAKLKKAKAKK